MKDVTNEISSYLENISLLILGVLLLAFPLIFTTLTTDTFTLPKQALLSLIVLVSLLLFGVKMISDGSVRLRRTPFDLPLFLFTLFAFLSCLLSVNRFDSLIAFVPLLLAILAYFIIVNLVRTASSVLFLVSSLVLGASLASILALLSIFKFYILPFPFTQIQTFSPFGSLLDQAIYLALVLPIASYPAVKAIKKTRELSGKTIGFGILSLLILGGLAATVYALVILQKPLILPFETGFQTAFAAISQDTGRILPGFLLGSGFGTYATDFTRFKQATFNVNPSLWSFTFFRSSSFVLELLATTGVLGLAAFVFLILRVLKESRPSKMIKENPIFLSLFLLLIASFVLPFSFTTQAMIFLLLGLFATLSETTFDVELQFVALKRGLISSSPLLTEGQTSESVSGTKIMPVILFITFVVFVSVIGFYTISYIASDIIFQNSLVAAAKNQGLETYNDQVNALKIFPHRDAYYRIYSQTNLALANSLVAQQPKDSSPSAQTQQTIYTLIQQSINAARSAVTISPQTVANWQNLSSIYRGLIGFGQNAENFAVSTSQQAILLDPNNPQEYINLGGLYYQLSQWDNAQRQFQIAVNLKPDFANAYYNLGHALESKEDLQNALLQYQAVKTLVANDPTNLKTITDEIDMLQKRMGSTEQKVKAQVQEGSTATNQPPLGISTPSAQLPEQKPLVKIPPPSAPTPSPSPTQ